MNGEEDRKRRAEQLKMEKDEDSEKFEMKSQDRNCTYTVQKL